MPEHSLGRPRARLGGHKLGPPAHPVTLQPWWCPRPWRGWGHGAVRPPPTRQEKLALIYGRGTLPRAPVTHYPPGHEGARNPPAGRDGTEGTICSTAAAEPVSGRPAAPGRLCPSPAAHRGAPGVVPRCPGGVGGLPAGLGPSLLSRPPAGRCLTPCRGSPGRTPSASSPRVPPPCHVPTQAPSKSLEGTCQRPRAQRPQGCPQSARAGPGSPIPRGFWWHVALHSGHLHEAAHVPRTGAAHTRRPQPRAQGLILLGKPRGCSAGTNSFREVPNPQILPGLTWKRR